MLEGSEIYPIAAWHAPILLQIHIVKQEETRKKACLTDDDKELPNYPGGHCRFEERKVCECVLVLTALTCVEAVDGTPQLWSYFSSAFSGAAWSATALLATASALVTLWAVKMNSISPK